jgi:hypothetical protein
LIAIGLCAWSTQAFAQTTETTVTTTNGALTEYVPGSQTVVVRSETNPTPLRYVVSRQTTIVDETGAPLALERIPIGNSLSVEYTGTGDRLVVSRIVAHKTVNAPVATQETTTMTTATHPLSREERHKLKEAEEHRRHEIKEQREHEKEAVEHATDEDH